MNDGKLTVMGEMGVSIFRRDSAMCCPSGMGNAKISSHHIEFFTTPNFLNAAGIATLGVADAMDATVLWRAVVAVPLYSLSIWFGSRLFRFASDDRYRRFALVLLFALYPFCAIQKSLGFIDKFR